MAAAFGNAVLMLLHHMLFMLHMNIGSVSLSCQVTVSLSCQASAAMQSTLMTRYSLNTDITVASNKM